jgi:hypothetical protein
MSKHRAAAVVIRCLGVTLATLAVAILALDVHRFGIAAGILALAMVALAAVAVTTPRLATDVRTTHSGPVERRAIRREPPTGIRAS